MHCQYLFYMLTFLVLQKIHSRPLLSENEVEKLEKSIKRRFRRHVQALGYSNNGKDRIIPPSDEKLMLRALQNKKRVEHLKEEKEFIRRSYPDLKDYFASGTEIDVGSISPILRVVEGGTEFSRLFRLACLTWGVPVSAGYGRRLRFVVIDKSNHKLVGLIGLADPVFNLSARDSAIGWTYQDRKARLVNAMNAYVLGALPPYNMLLGGKLVSALVRTREVKNAFSGKYRHAKGIISGVEKKPSLVMVTTTSSLGRSAIYDRVRLRHDHENYTQYFSSVGFTSGWGHFHVPNSLFVDMRKYLELKDHPYANGYKYGNGSNWRLRVAQAALRLVGLNTDLMNHGVKREVFVCRLAANADSVLKGETKRPLYSDLLSAKEVGNLASERWIIPRSNARREYLSWRSEDILKLLNPKLNGLASLQIQPPIKALNAGHKNTASTVERVCSNTNLAPTIEDRIMPPEVTVCTDSNISNGNNFNIVGQTSGTYSHSEKLRSERKSNDR